MSSQMVAKTCRFDLLQAKGAILEGDELSAALAQAMAPASVTTADLKLARDLEYASFYSMQSQKCTTEAAARQ